VIRDIARALVLLLALGFVAAEVTESQVSNNPEWSNE
jgi:hypothetical protein